MSPMYIDEKIQYYKNETVGVFKDTTCHVWQIKSNFST